MTVELVTDPDTPGQGPFVWPKEPESWDPWGKEDFAKAVRDQEEMKNTQKEWEFGMLWPKDMGRVGEQAGDLLKKAGRARDLVTVGWREDLKKRREQEQKEEDDRVRERMEAERTAKKEASQKLKKK